MRVARHVLSIADILKRLTRKIKFLVQRIRTLLAVEVFVNF